MEDLIIYKLKQYIKFATILKYIWWLYPISYFIGWKLNVNEGFCKFIDERCKDSDYLRKIFKNEVELELNNSHHKNQTGFFYPIFLSKLSSEPFTLRIEHAKRTISRLENRTILINIYGLNYLKEYRPHLFP